MKDIKAIISSYLDQIVTYRRHIHQNPELSHDEVNTSYFIAQTLKKMGLQPTTGVGGNGVTAVINGAKPGKCVGLRADFDALPIQETTDLAFASQNAGVSHSCGHDMHTAMLLGAAHVLLSLKDEFSGSVKLVFQPAEEDVLDCGAVPMIRDGALENPHVDAMIGQHVWPQYLVGTAAVRNGAMMASSDRFHITVHGKSSHGSAPEDGIDAIVIAAQVITALQTIVSRKVSPRDAAVVSIGTIHGGDRYNVIANQVKLEGTCRNLNPEVRNKMPERIEQIAKGVAESMGGSCDVAYFKGYSPTVNAPEMFALVHGVMKEVVGDGAYVPEMSALGGEDFSFYCEKIPCAFFWLGVQTPGKPFYPIHNGGFSPDENAIPIGIEIAVRSALTFLAK
ncbi:MAG TPA: amidohydrolase [Clostridia bacterium]|nr:amidohydrolase [Clostridia bacterium]